MKCCAGMTEEWLAVRALERCAGMTEEWLAGRAMERRADRIKECARMRMVHLRWQNYADFNKFLAGGRLPVLPGFSRLRGLFPE